MKKVWLIGSGMMTREYIKVLDELGTDYIVIGRGEDAVNEVKELTSKSVIAGGLEKFLDGSPELVDHAIVATPVETLLDCTKQLIEYGVKNILVEKPGVVNREELVQLLNLNHLYRTNILLAYNRRFYSSVLKLKELVNSEGGIKSCHFEFTEWSHRIQDLKKDKNVMQKWFLGNSTHVVDTVFYLIGKPKELSSHTRGSLNWHKSASIFCGSGITDKDILFSYNSNWESAGRWSIEVSTNMNRYILRPMEELKVINRGTTKVLDVNMDSALDKQFKPGLFLQTEKFLDDDLKLHCDLDDISNYMDIYYSIANYK